MIRHVQVGNSSTPLFVSQMRKQNTREKWITRSRITSVSPVPGPMISLLHLSSICDGSAASIQVPETVWIKETVPEQLHQHDSRLHAEFSWLAYRNSLHQADSELTCLFFIF